VNVIVVDRIGVATFSFVEREPEYQRLLREIDKILEDPELTAEIVRVYVKRKYG